MVIIVYNPAKDLAQKTYQEIRDWLEKKSYTVRTYHPHDCFSNATAPKADFAISLGGDGTFLSCARLLSTNPIPILAVHLGSFGFITELTQHEWEETLTSWVAGRLHVEERMTLKIIVRRKGKEFACFTGINDAVVSAGEISKVVRLSIKLGGITVGDFRGDGMILSTPTGSTAYSMAAGGPILLPLIQALVLTPICPFSLAWRPMVLPANENVIIRIKKEQRADVLLSIDGQELRPLEEGDEVSMIGQPGGTQIIKSKKRVFYEVLRSKLGWSGAPHA